MTIDPGNLFKLTYLVMIYDSARIEITHFFCGLKYFKMCLIEPRVLYFNFEVNTLSIILKCLINTQGADPE